MKISRTRNPFGLNGALEGRLSNTKTMIELSATITVTNTFILQHYNSVPVW